MKSADMKIVLLVLYAATRMAEHILNWGRGGGAYKRGPETLTCRVICKIIILCIFGLKGVGVTPQAPRLRHP